MPRIDFAPGPRITRRWANALHRFVCNRWPAAMEANMFFGAETLMSGVSGWRPERASAHRAVAALAPVPIARFRGSRWFRRQQNAVGSLASTEQKLSLTPVPDRIEWQIDANAVSGRTKKPHRLLLLNGGAGTEKRPNGCQRPQPPTDVMNWMFRF